MHDDDPGYDAVMNLFRHKCVRCFAPAVTVHEIYPKGMSSDKAALDMDNRVCLCSLCHSWAHLMGTKNSIPALLEARERALGFWTR